MLHLAVKHIGDGLDTPVGVPGKSGEVMAGIVGMEVIKQQEGIQLGDLVIAKGPLEMHTRPFHSGLALP
jgi:hypothetical protein